MVSELRDALNTIWRVPEDTVSSRDTQFFQSGEGAAAFVRTGVRRGRVSAVVAHCEYLGLRRRHVSQVVGRASAAAHSDRRLGDLFALITALFAFIFKSFPSVRLEWSDVAAGAVLTSLLFTAGKLLLGIYLGKAGFADIYGPAGSLVILFVWVYYSAQVVFFGAEFTRAYTLRCGSMLAGESRVRL